MLFNPVTRNDVLVGSDNEETTLRPANAALVPYSILYPIIGLPPLLVGAVQFNITWRFSAVARKLLGEAGAPRGVNVTVAGVLRPHAFRVTTRIVYDTPLVRPPI